MKSILRRNIGFFKVSGIILGLASIPPVLFISMETLFDYMWPNNDPFYCGDYECHCPSDSNCPRKVKLRLFHQQPDYQDLEKD
jgi:hypothetical protein